jgi:hypothetical protein
MNRIKLNEITDRLEGKPYLSLVETSVLKIPERLEEYDPNMFICFNSIIQEYAVHSLRNREGNTHALSIPWPELDHRVLDFVAMRDQNRRPLKEILREIDQHNEAIDIRKDKQRHNDLNAIAREVRPVFKRFAEERGI